MSIKTKAGQIWTDSVAYVALLVGAGLSIAGNVANVYRTRGAAVDTLDVVLAVAFPGLVVLMVEVFVSARWKGLGWPMQVLRWVGTLAIGAVAMRVSWTHLHELMLSRGQAGDVATFGPLAIDALAIMATALILAGRGRALPAPTATETADEILARRQDEANKLAARTAIVFPAVATQAEADESAAIVANPGAYLETGVADEARTWLDTLAETTSGETTAAFPVSPAPMSNTVKPEAVPAEAREALEMWTAASPAERPTAKVRNEILASAHNVSTRTIRRWASALGESATAE
jgi:hypothetical protein